MALNKILDGKGRIANGIRAMPRVGSLMLSTALDGTPDLVLSLVD
jgi:hypothetical protein